MTTQPEIKVGQRWRLKGSELIVKVTKIYHDVVTSEEAGNLFVLKTCFSHPRVGFSDKLELIEEAPEPEKKGG